MRTLLILLAAMSVAAATDISLQWKGTEGWGRNSAYCRLYDTHSMVTLKGIVQRVEKIIPMPGMGYGVHLILKTPAETIPVHLGPKWYVQQQAVQIQAEDAIEVTGSRVLCDGKPVILAAVIQRGKDTVRYRQLDGIPGWVGRQP